MFEVEGVNDCNKKVDLHRQPKIFTFFNNHNLFGFDFRLTTWNLPSDSSRFNSTASPRSRNTSHVLVLSITSFQFVTQAHAWLVVSRYHLNLYRFLLIVRRFSNEHACSNCVYFFYYEFIVYDYCDVLNLRVFNCFILSHHLFSSAFFSATTSSLCRCCKYFNRSLWF